MSLVLHKFFTESGVWRKGMETTSFILCVILQPAGTCGNLTVLYKFRIYWFLIKHPVLAFPKWVYGHCSLNCLEFCSRALSFDDLDQQFFNWKIMSFMFFSIFFFCWVFSLHVGNATGTNRALTGLFHLMSFVQSMKFKEDLGNWTVEFLHLLYLSSLTHSFSIVNVNTFPPELA